VSGKPVLAAFAVVPAFRNWFAAAVLLFGAVIHTDPSENPVGHEMPGLAPTVAVAVRSKKSPSMQ
jgi:hypothetical protein